MSKEKNQQTEERILETAIEVFQERGMAATRMQEIADRAGINKALLHYYFRSKQQLFEAVFSKCFMQFAPKVNSIFQSEEPLFDKLYRFADNYITFMLKNRFLVPFIVQEMNNNSEFAFSFLDSVNRPDPTIISGQIKAEIEAGNIKPIHPKQLLLSIFSLVAFPFAAQVLIKGLLKMDDEEFVTLMNERKTLIPDMIKNALKP
tara:strand:- start:84 stop:695 length:612 start_codon:yes stop_codon:yes gene_type:complete